MQIKRRLLLMCMLLILLPLLAGAESAQNLLINGDFEQRDQDGLPTGWYTEAYRNQAGITEFGLTDAGRNGSTGAAVVQNFGLNDARFAQLVPVEPDSLYRLSGYIKTEGVADYGWGANLSVSVGFTSTEGVYESEGDWTYVEMYGLTGEDQHDVTVYARVGGFSGDSEGKAIFDDLSLVKVDWVPAGASIKPWYKVEKAEMIDPNPDEFLGEEALAEEEIPGPAWPLLLVIAAVYIVISCWMHRSLKLDKAAEARREMKQRGVRKYAGMPIAVGIGLVIAFVIRVIVALNVDGYAVDVGCFTSWGGTMASVGPTMFYQSTWCDYPPAYVYVMGLNGLLTRLAVPTVPASFVYKLVPMICDIVAAWLVYRLAVDARCSRAQAGSLALLLALNPAIALNSAAWCQIDSVLCVGLMLVAYLAMKRKWEWVLPVYVLCVLIKPQALMLGFLGLAAIIQSIVQAEKGEERSKVLKQMGIGLAISAGVALVIILPFCLKQENFWWLFELYTKTLSSYPHATVNTTNLYYLFRGNWKDIIEPAAKGLGFFFAAVSASWGVYCFLKTDRTGLKEKWPLERLLIMLEPCMMACFALTFLVMEFIGVSWSVIGVTAMVLTFAVVLPMYIRSGKLIDLPLCGAVLFLLLYVFGIKMHERYLFPALFLFAMAYAVRRDRRILWLMAITSGVLFVNEGIVLDNSVRLGSAMGHLNNDTLSLAMALSAVNVVCALASVWVCHDLCVRPSKTFNVDGALKYVTSCFNCRQYDKVPLNPLNYHTDSRLRWKRKDTLLMLAVTAIYAVVTLTTLGSTKAPQSSWRSSTAQEYAVIDLGKRYEDFSMLYYCEVSDSDFQVATSDDGETWADTYWAKMNEGECFRWLYLVPSVETDTGVTYLPANDYASVQKMSGQYVKIMPGYIGLTLNEVIFRDAEGNGIPATVVGSSGGNEASARFTDPEALLDEQDTLTGEPSWWNSTYFDEIYHARTAHELLNNEAPYETSHPPLGKIIMSWCVAIFGMTPFGWRFAGALCGVLMLPAMYLIAKQLTKRTDMAFAAMTMMALDCMHLTQTRIATIDSFPVLFIILSYFFMLRFMQRDIVLDDMRRILPDLALSGFFMGCGFASKWIGAYAGIGLAVLFFWTCIRHLRIGIAASRMLRQRKGLTQEQRELLTRRDRPAMDRVIRLCLWCLLFFVAVPVAIYLLAYVDHMAYRKFDSIGAWFREFWHIQDYSMLRYHSKPGLGMNHPFYSPWYEWPTMRKPMYYASSAIVPQGWDYALFCFGNPAVWYAGLAGIGYAVYRWAHGHCYLLRGEKKILHVDGDSWDIAPAFILIGLLAQFLPWVLVPRGTYIYHYFASIPFLILGTTYLLHAFTKALPQTGRGVLVGYLLVCLVFFILLFPYASGVLTPTWWLDFVRDMKITRLYYV